MYPLHKDYGKQKAINTMPTTRTLSAVASWKEWAEKMRLLSFVILLMLVLSGCYSDPQTSTAETDNKNNQVMAEKYATVAFTTAQNALQAVIKEVYINANPTVLNDDQSLNLSAVGYGILHNQDLVKAGLCNGHVLTWFNQSSQTFGMKGVGTAGAALINHAMSKKLSKENYGTIKNGIVHIAGGFPIDVQSGGTCEFVASIPNHSPILIMAAEVPVAYVDRTVEGYQFSDEPCPTGEQGKISSRKRIRVTIDEYGHRTVQDLTSFQPYMNSCNSQVVTPDVTVAMAYAEMETFAGASSFPEKQNVDCGEITLRRGEGENEEVVSYSTCADGPTTGLTNLPEPVDYEFVRILRREETQRSCTGGDWQGTATYERIIELWRNTVTGEEYERRGAWEEKDIYCSRAEERVVACPGPMLEAYGSGVTYTRLNEITDFELEPSNPDWELQNFECSYRHECGAVYSMTDHYVNTLLSDTASNSDAFIIGRYFEPWNTNACTPGVKGPKGLQGPQGPRGDNDDYTDVVLSCPTGQVMTGIVNNQPVCRQIVSDVCVPRTQTSYKVCDADVNGMVIQKRDFDCAQGQFGDWYSLYDSCTQGGSVLALGAINKSQPDRLNELETAAGTEER